MYSEPNPPSFLSSRGKTGLAALISLSLCACNATSPLRQATDGASELVQSQSPISQSAQTASTGLSSTSAPAQQTPPTTKQKSGTRPAAIAAQGSARPAVMRPTGQLNTLFAKGMVSGRDLITELRAIQALNRSRNTQHSFANLMGALDRSLASPQGSAGVNWSSIGKGITDAALDELRASISQSALDQFLSTVVGDEQVLAQEKINLPNTPGLTPVQQQRIANMAAMVIGGRIAGRTLKDAEGTFKNMEGEYQDLITRRQQVAAVLADVVDKRRKAAAAKDELTARQMTQELARYLAADDIAFIDTFGKEMNLKDFSNDFTMQNIALQYMRKSDPASYKEYRVRSDGLVGHAKAYVKTVGGVAAFGGLLIGFYKEANDIAQAKQGQEVISALPLGAEFISTMIPLIPTVLSTAYSGVVMEPVNDVTSRVFGVKRFRIITEDKETEARNASDVFKAIREAGEEVRLQEALFRSNASGFLYKMYTCDAEEVGRILDNTVSEEKRQRFNTEFMRGNDGDAFHFVDVLGNSRYPRHSQLVSEFLGQDQRQRASRPVVGDVQREVVAGYAKWSESQLTRLILANNTGPASHAQLQMGKVQIRLVPTMTAVTEYESLQDSCRRTASKS